MRINSGKTDIYLYFVAVDATDYVTRETGLATWTVQRSRNGAAEVAYTTPTITEIDAANMPGVYALLVDEDTTLGGSSDNEEYCVHITHAGMAPVTRTIELYRRDTTTLTSITVSGGAITTATNVTTVNGLAANVITAASMNADASEEIADAVWDEDATGHQTQGSFGQAIGDPVADTNTIYKAVVTDATGATVGIDVVAVKADTAAILVDTGTTLDAALAVVDANVDAILVDTGTTLDAAIAVIDGNVDAILVDTAEIGAAGAGLTNINLPNQTMDIVGNITGSLSGSVGSVTGSVGSIAGGGITTGSFAAGAIDAAAIAANAIGASELAADAATEIADALLNRDMSAVSDTNARTPLNALRFLRNKWSISGTTLTVTEEDDTTAAWTSTVTPDAAADPIIGSDPA